MIRKILSIKNVGRFENCAWRGGTQFEKMSLMYAENGRGKSTFCDILRSWQTNEPNIVLGRKRLGATGDCEIALLSEGGKKATFKAGKWDVAKPELAIFDMAFVHQNVYAGDHIDHEHKKNLYRVIVGENGVKLAKKVEDLDADSREATKLAKTKLDLINAKLPPGRDMKAFAKILADDQIAQKIAAKEEEIKTTEFAEKKAADIQAKGLLQEIALPAVQGDVEQLLAKKLPALQQDAETQLREHLKSHTRGATEVWISEGLGYLKDETCPLCGQSTHDLNLIKAYQAFFDTSYATLKSSLTRTERVVATSFDERVISQAQKRLTDNAALHVFWRELGITTGKSLPVIDAMSDVLSNIRNEAIALLKEKSASPLDAVPLSENFEASKKAYNDVCAKILTYNEEARTFNAAVTAYKGKQGTNTSAKLKAELAELKLIQLRHSPEMLKMIAEYKAAEENKKKLAKEKDEAKNHLDAHSATVLSLHEIRINDLLKRFAAGFKIGSTDRSYVGGKPSSSFKLLINNVGVELGDENTPSSRPSFRNTLSAGDRSTLALAFFIAQLERDANLADKIVVFDDPFTSQDRSRRTATQTLICNLESKVKQVLLFSHDPHFLRSVWNGRKSGAAISCFQFSRMANGTAVGEWDVEKETASEYTKKHRVLWEYCFEAHVFRGSTREVAQTIRPVLEEYLKLKLPHCFADTEWLGDFIGKIRNAPAGDPLEAAKPILPSVEQINEYAKRFHHRSNPSAETEIVEDTELLTFVQMTLDVVGGF